MESIMNIRTLQNCFAFFVLFVVGSASAYAIDIRNQTDNKVVVHVDFTGVSRAFGVEVAPGEEKTTGSGFTQRDCLKKIRVVSGGENVYTWSASAPVLFNSYCESVEITITKDGGDFRINVEKR